MISSPAPVRFLTLRIFGTRWQRRTAGRLTAKSWLRYTAALLTAVPRRNMERRTALYALPGTPPDLRLELDYCPFAARCRYAMPICRREMPGETDVGTKKHPQRAVRLPADILYSAVSCSGFGMENLPVRRACSAKTANRAQLRSCRHNQRRSYVLRPRRRSSGLLQELYQG